MKRTLTLTFCSLVSLGNFTANADAKTQAKTWTDPKAASQDDPDFLIQGEYGKAKAGAKYGVQVIAMGHGTFDAYLLEGGLPGLGWERGKSRQLLKGKSNGEKIDFTNEQGTITGTISDGQFILTLPKATHYHESSGRARHSTPQPRKMPWSFLMVVRRTNGTTARSRMDFFSPPVAPASSASPTTNST